MKRIPLALAFILSLLFTAQAGYIIRGVTTSPPPATDLMNYTLTFDATGEPIAAASMNHSNGTHSIVIVRANTNAAHIFTHPADANADIIVKDFQYISKMVLICFVALEDHKLL